MLCFVEFVEGLDMLCFVEFVEGLDMLCCTSMNSV